ncbi:putative immunity protein [Paeniglutamicibacter sp. MACA_103]|uniref:putative immunity protein n=1 Tax=Paeniglutamicibacter sp. MACA_103 TaxID=3377337 RepID=UPI003894336D
MVPRQEALSSSVWHAAGLAASPLEGDILNTAGTATGSILSILSVFNVFNVFNVVHAAAPVVRRTRVPEFRGRYVGSMPILPKERDPRLVTIRRGGTLSDEHHRLLAGWALDCAEHVLPLFEDRQPEDGRPRHAIEVGRGWIRGEVPMREAHHEAFIANAAARGMPEPAKFAALAAGQAVAVAHVAAHDLGAAAYAIRAAGAGAVDAAAARAAEREWQRALLPAAVRDLVLEDQQRRSAICWNVFDE